MPRFRLKRERVSRADLADRARDAGDWELAARLYGEALEREPDDPPIWVQYGHALKESGKLQDPEKLAQAEFAYRRALSLDPSAADTYLQLGHVLKLQGKTEEAQAAYLRAFALDPSLSHPLDELGGLGWPQAQQLLLRGIGSSSGELDNGVASEQFPFEATSPGSPATDAKAISNLNHSHAHSAYSISQVDVHSLLTRYAVSDDGSISAAGPAGSPLEAWLGNYSTSIGAVHRQDSPTELHVAERPEVLNAVILALRWDLDGVNEQLRDALSEKAELEARVRVLEAKLHDLRPGGEVTGSLAEGGQSGPHHAPAIINPRPVDHQASPDDITPIDQDLRPLFDPEYYGAQATARGLAVDDALSHFDLIGGPLGMSPHPLFDWPIIWRRIQI